MTLKCGVAISSDAESLAITIRIFYAFHRSFRASTESTVCPAWQLQDKSNYAQNHFDASNPDIASIKYVSSLECEVGRIHGDDQ